MFVGAGMEVLLDVVYVLLVTAGTSFTIAGAFATVPKKSFRAEGVVVAAGLDHDDVLAGFELNHEDVDVVDGLDHEDVDGLDQLELEL